MEGSRGLTEIPRSDPVHFPSSQEVPSSPPSVISEAGTRRKPKRPPPVTPRSFKRFFTPRSALNAGNNTSSVKTNRQALGEISSPTLNRRGPAFTKVSNDGHHGAPKNPFAELARTPSRKRKLSFFSPGSPQQSSPLRKVRVAAGVDDDRVLEKTVGEIEIGPAIGVEEPNAGHIASEIPSVRPLRRSRALGTSGELCLRSISGRMNRVIHRANYGTGLFRILPHIQGVTFNSVNLQAGKIKRPISILVRMTSILASASQGNVSRFPSVLRLVIVSKQGFSPYGS